MSTGSVSVITGGTFQNFVSAYNGKLTLEGGIYKSTVSTAYEGSLIIKGGYFTTAPYVKEGVTGSLSVEGGYYVVDPTDEYLKDDCAVFAEDNTYQSTTYHYIIDGSVTIATASRAAEGDLTYVANLQGGGMYRKGASITLTASESAASRYTFKGWYDGTTLLSAETTATLTASETAQYDAVYEYGGAVVDFTVDIRSAAANFSVKIGDAEYGSAVSSYFAENVKAGTVYTVKYEGTEPFIAWQNGIKKFMTKDKEYEFTVGSDVTLEALYTAGTGAKKVAFVNSHNQILKLVDWTEGTVLSAVAPEVPYRTGRTSDGKWYLGGEEATETLINGISENYIALIAKYENSTDTYTVTLKKATVAGTTWTEETEALATYTQPLVNLAKISVSDTVNFVGFKTAEDGEFLSYSPSFVYHGEADVTLYAVFSEAEAEKKAMITMTGAKVTNGTGASFEATRSIPEDCTLVEQGILLTTGTLLGENTFEAAEAALVVGGAKAMKQVSSGTEANGVTTLNVSKIGTLTVYARGYVIYQKDGVNAVIYTDIAYGTALGGFTIGK